jgi:hypothetical protein
LSAASLAYINNNDGAQNTPPYSTPNGSREPGQCTFAIGGPQYPYLYVDGKAQNYWIDLEVTPGGVGGTQPTATPTPTATSTASPPPVTTPLPTVNPGAFLSFFG